MREMILNHTSVQCPDRQTAIGWLKDVSTGMAHLVSNKVVQSSLRMKHPEQEITCLPDYSLFDAYQDLRKNGARDEYGFLMRLSTKCPLLREVELDIKDRFQACEAKQLPSEDGEPLVFCAITDCIAVGFPSESVWDSDRLAVSFDELLPDASIEERCESIDNLTRFVHARLIYERHRETFLQFESPLALWEHRECHDTTGVFSAHRQETRRTRQGSCGMAPRRRGYSPVALQSDSREQRAKKG